MDEKQLAVANARVGGIETRIGSLIAKQRTTQAALATDHADVQRAVERRGHLVAQLMGASDGTAKQLHHEIDAVDAAIRVSERMAESRQKLLATTAQEIESLRIELQAAEAEVEAEENARAFQAWTVRYKQALRGADEALGAARVALANLNTLSAQGVEKFKGQASQIVEPGLEKFSLENNNADTYGWRTATPFYTNRLSFMVHPQVRR
jgi:dGTP triphosphohydrolase